MPFPGGSHSIQVTLTNFGANTITNTIISWSVNGVEQTPFAWTGSLSSGAKQSNIPIGNYNFVSGQKTVFKIWQANPNGEQDGYALNDSLNKTLYTALCGTYSVGGSSPDFVSFTEVATALNNAGVACPVVFEIRDGIYDEQIKLYEISGASEVNTITFRGESGDSSLVALHYTTSNPSNDFTLALTGTDYISFEDMGVLRTNGTYSVLIQNESSHVRFEGCRLGNVISPATSVDGYLTFRKVHMEGYDLNLQHPDHTTAGEVIVENNFVRNVIITNSGPVSVKGNRISDGALYAQDFTVNRSKDIEVTENRMRMLIINYDTIVSVNNNTIYRYDAISATLTGIYSESSAGVAINLNTVTHTNRGTSSSANTRGVELVNSRNSSLSQNVINVFHRGYSSSANGIGVYVRGTNTKYLSIEENFITNNSDGGTRHGIAIDNGDNIYVKHNTLNGTNITYAGRGIQIINPQGLTEVDSNMVRNYQSHGLYARVSNAECKFRNNRFENIKDLGIWWEGSNGIFTNNTVTGVIAGSGIHITASNSTVTENRFLNIQAGTGIIVDGANNLVANNFVEAEGVGIAKGISLRANGTGSEIVFNSVNITGTDVANGIGLEVLGGTDYIVKNNILANNGGDWLH
ncbi:MAG: right-handed parallel beta-helix repeat-containing protein [Bacteroidota bacterium]